MTKQQHIDDLKGEISLLRDSIDRLLESLESELMGATKKFIDRLRNY